MKEQLLNSIDSYNLISQFIGFSKKELGDIKVKEIISNVENSGKVSKFINEARQINQQLGSDDFLACIHSSIKFTFSKAEVIAVATIWLLNIWNEKIGVPNQISNEDYLKKRINTILEKCEKYKVHLNSQPNFFDNFYTYLKSQQNGITKDIEDPHYWIWLAIEATNHYNLNPNQNTNIWDEYKFNTFILNCGIIYLIKFPDEVEQIGWDYGNEKKNLFNELILKISDKFFGEKKIKTGENIGDKCKDIDEMDNLIKYFALYILRFMKRRDITYMHMITYNVCHTLITNEFDHVGHEKNVNETETIAFANKFSKAFEYITNSFM